MWPQSGGQPSPPMVPSLIQESQRVPTQFEPSNSRLHQTLTFDPLHLAPTEVVGTGGIYRWICEEEPNQYRELDYNGSLTRIDIDLLASPELIDLESMISSENMNTISALGIPMVPQPTALARQVASKVIKHVRDIKYPNEHHMWCPDCRLFPVLPVTGICGHTRCTMCIQQNGACPCGSPAPKTLHLNILIQDLIVKMLPSETQKTGTCCSGDAKLPNELPSPSTSSGGCQDSSSGPERPRRQSRSLHCSSLPISTRINAPCRHPVSPQARYKHARDLWAAGRYREAAPHFAHIAASSEIVAKTARLMLAQIITTMSEEGDPRRLTRDLYRSVREQSATAWLKPSDLECIICYQVLRRPVTTPCGHTFCRVCIERILENRKRCALCSRSLHSFSIAQTADTGFVCSALSAIDTLAVPTTIDSDFIPIFACTVAYPAIPCPLLIFDPRYWVMIRKVLESGSRKFGMVTYERDRSFSDYGTILEVRDCVQFEDGRSILSTVGVTRFRVIERTVRDGCQMARVLELTDIIPTVEIMVWELQLLAQQISYKALLWLSTLDRSLVADIEAAFGHIPQFNDAEVWWENPNGPKWLWWIIAILPLRSEIQVLMLSTKHLHKRMMAVSRTLEVMDQVALSPGPTNFDLESEIYLVYQNNRAHRRQN